MSALVIAHRGCCRRAPANSLEAFELACSSGADMIELDVRRTLDGEYIAFHDAALGTTPTSRLTYGQIIELRNEKPVRRRLGRLEGGRPPLLEQVLRHLGGRIGFDIELKELGYEREILDLALDHMPPEKLVITSFEDSAVAASKRHRPDVRAGLLLGSGSSSVRGRVIDLLPLPRRLACGADFLAPYHRLIDAPGLTRDTHEPAPLVPWTVNRGRRIEALLADERVEAIITDVPELAVRARAKVGRFTAG